MQRHPRQRDEPHLAFIRQLSCIVCGDNTSTEAAHIRFADQSIGKQNSGLGQKPHDYFTVPLCGKCHRRQHTMNEREFWRGAGIDPILYALALYAVSGNHDRGCEIVSNAGLCEPLSIMAAG